MRWAAALAGEHPEGRFAFALATALSSASAWRSIVDLSRHGEIVPMTRGEAPPPESLRVGDRVVARTGVGRWTFDDVMVVRELDSPRHVLFEKVGRPLHGSVLVNIESAHGDADAFSQGCEVSWTQTFVVPWLVLPPPLARVVGKALSVALCLGYRSVVARLLALSHAAN